jgi:foldase protein PrsA
MKTLIRSCTVVVIALAAGAVGFFAGAQDTPKAEPERTLKVNEVARVGERVITAEEFIQRLIEREQIYQDPDLRSATWALDSLILEEMLESERTRLQADPKRREIDAEYDILNKEFEAQLAQHNKDLEVPYTREQFIEAKTGLSVVEFDAKLRQIAMENLVRRMVVNYWTISTDSADAEGLQMASKDDLVAIRLRLLKGEKLGPIARANSTDMHTREGNGVIGTVYPKDGTFAAPELETAFWSLKDGEWSDPIKTDTGYWLVRKAKSYLGNQAQFFDLRDECLKRRNPSDELMIKWRHALAGSGRLKFERRMPGWDVQAGEQ